MIGRFFGHLRQWLDLFVSLRKSSVAFGSLLKYIVVKWPKTPGYIKQNNIGLFGAVFASFWKKITVSKIFLLLVLTVLKNEVFSVIEVGVV